MLNPKISSDKTYFALGRERERERERGSAHSVGETKCDVTQTFLSRGNHFAA